MDTQNNSRLEQQIRFLKEIDREKFIKRHTLLSDGKTRENDAEHSWHMAVMAILLSEYANCEIDVLHTVTMLLIHDLVEIDAGDMYAYDEEAKKTQAVREAQAAERIFHLLPDDQAQKMLDLWREFEAGETPEARFARTMDNFQPAMLNSVSEGKAWEERGIRLSQILERNRNTSEGSEKLWEYSYDNFIKPSVDTGKIIDS